MLLLSNFPPPNPPPPKKKSFLVLSKYPAANRPSLVLANWLLGSRVCSDYTITPCTVGTRPGGRNGFAPTHQGLERLQPPARQGLLKALWVVLSRNSW